MKRSLIVLLSIVLLAGAALAQTTQLKVSTGSSTGTYSRMFKEFAGTCKDQILMIEQPSTGSIQNMDRLLGNEVNAAIVQTDVLFHRARNEDLSNIKTLIALHPEEVHVITRSESPIKEGGFGGIGSKPISLTDVTSLAGRTVAAWGGGMVTAQVIRLQTEIPFTVAEVTDFKSAREGLDSGKFAAIIMVGGQPLVDVSTLNSSYKLMPFPESTAGKLKSVYVPAKLNYSGLGAGGTGIQTIATEALFVTREYKTDKYVQSLGALRTCFKAKVEEIAETTGTHKKWTAVKTTNNGKWPYYDLPVTGGTLKRK
jgi:TRAP-type uncharacterized transport system substrate-binding protein